MSSNNDHEEDFAQLLENSESGTGNVSLFPGDSVEGTVVMIGKDAVFIDFGSKAEGWAELAEFYDDDDELTVKVGDRVKLLMLQYGKSGMQFGTKIRTLSPSAGMNTLEEAYHSGMPIEALVKDKNKGGFDLEIMGVRAFCPISQIDDSYCEDPDVFVDQTLTFKVVEFDLDDRRVVLSRKALLEEEKERVAEVTRETLGEGEKYKGVIRKLMSYGAFIEFGGLDGFVHVSEIAHEHVSDPADVLSIGQEIDVQVLKIEEDKNGKERIGLSIKALITDPWDEDLPFSVGDIVVGTVKRIEDFGAFVEITKNMEGLLHISEIALERINHPSDKLAEGDSIEVLVKGIDLERRRISLSIRDLLAKAATEKVKKEVPSDDVRKDNVILRRRATPAEEPAIEEPMNVPDDPWADVDAAQRKADEEKRAEGSEDDSPKQLTARIGLVTNGIIASIMPYGMFIELPECGPKARGLLHNSEIAVRDGDPIPRDLKEGDTIEVEIIRIDDQGRLGLSRKTVLIRNERVEVAKFQQKLENESKMGTMGNLFKNIKLDKK